MHLINTSYRELILLYSLAKVNLSITFLPLFLLLLEVIDTPFTQSAWLYLICFIYSIVNSIHCCMKTYPPTHATIFENMIRILTNWGSCFASVFIISNICYTENDFSGRLGLLGPLGLGVENGNKLVIRYGITHFHYGYAGLFIIFCCCCVIYFAILRALIVSIVLVYQCLYKVYLGFLGMILPLVLDLGS